MKLTIEKRKFARIWFYVIVLGLAMSVWRVQVHMYDKIFKAFSQPGTILSASTNANAVPTDWQQISFQAMSDITGLLTTLGTALLGAIGLLMVQSGKASKSRSLWAAFLAAICGGISLYFGYVSHLNILAMIQVQNQLPVYNSVYQFSNQAQFYTLLAGAFFFADFAFHGMGAEE